MIKARIAEDHSERRQASRHRVALDATVRELGATGTEATVLNISERGFMAKADGARISPRSSIERRAERGIIPPSRKKPEANARLPTSLAQSYIAAA